MTPRQPPLTGPPAAVFDKRKCEGRRTQPAETVAFAAGGRNLPARHCRARHGAGIGSQNEAEPAALMGGKSEPPRHREIGLCARKLGYDRARRAAFECLLHRP
jgi:hypothetical protein